MTTIEPDEWPSTGLLVACGAAALATAFVRLVLPWRHRTWPRLLT